MTLTFRERSAMNLRREWGNLARGKLYCQEEMEKRTNVSHLHNHAAACVTQKGYTMMLMHKIGIVTQ